MSALATAASRRPDVLSVLARRGGVIYRSYVARRVLKAVLTIFLISTMTFFLVRLLPGNPVDTYINTLIGQYGMYYANA
ncbi:MAG TPA: hypothetical protein VFB50_17860, partial [Chloroflexota bacterium]|nr:hypothetical protein [Chloroflexota bacterium]